MHTEVPNRNTQPHLIRTPSTPQHPAPTPTHSTRTTHSRIHTPLPHSVPGCPRRPVLHGRSCVRRLGRHGRLCGRTLQILDASEQLVDKGGLVARQLCNRCPRTAPFHPARNSCGEEVVPARQQMVYFCRPVLLQQQMRHVCPIVPCTLCVGA